MSKVFIKHWLWMPTASLLCFAGDSPCRSVNVAFSSCQVYKEEPRNNQRREILRKLHRKLHLQPRAESQTTRHLACNVTRMGLAVRGGDSRRDLERRWNIKREQGVTGLIERTRWMILDYGLRHSGGLWLEICLGLIWLASFPQGDARRGRMNIC